jgi:two-component system LytT family response regulator
MRALEARLDPQRFTRVHRSAIVGIHGIRELKSLPSGDHAITMRSGAEAALSRTYRDEALRRLAT